MIEKLEYLIDILIEAAKDKGEEYARGEYSNITYLLDKDRSALVEYVTGLESENARLREAARWIPVSERLPESPDYCLVIYDNRDYNRAIAFYKNGDWYKYSDWMISNVTHWMLLPKPPEVE